jgi:hypothetical protein
MFHVSCFMFHASCFMFHASCFMFHVSSFMFHVSCFMFHVSCFMFHDVTGGSDTPSSFSSPRARADSKIWVLIEYSPVSPCSARRGRDQGSGRSFTDLL